MEIQDFFEALYSNCGEDGYLECRQLPTQHRGFFPVSKGFDPVVGWCKNEGWRDVYFGVALRNPGGGKKENVLAIPAVWCDLDLKDFPTIAAMRKRVMDFPLEPSLIVDSGGGYHVYWVLKEPAGPEDIPLIEGINRRLVTFLNGDSQSVDASRILRVPGTKNTKYKPPKQVYCFHGNGKEYNLWDFDFLPEVQETPADRSTDEPVIKSGKIKLIDGHRDESLFHAALCMIRGGMAEGDGCTTIKAIAAQCIPPFDGDWEEKVRSAVRTHQGKTRNLADEIRSWVDLVEGSFSSNDLDRDLKLLERTEKKNRSIILKRLINDKILEKDGKRVGMYRKICTEFDYINPLETHVHEFDIKLPLQEEELVYIYPKNIIVLAGSTNTGKTAYCLNVAKDNMAKHRIWYMSSEMGPMELHSRLQLFESPKPEEWPIRCEADESGTGITFIEKSSDWGDFIRPNAINIIDYIEINDAFYQVGGILRTIHDRLNEGVAIVCLQKKGGQMNTTGRGADFTLEKPRLALAMDNGIAKIVKAKNVRNPQNHPQGKSRNFRIVKGASILPINSWAMRDE